MSPSVRKIENVYLETSLMEKLYWLKMEELLKDVGKKFPNISKMFHWIFIK
jgi:hypothetical protein